MATVVTKKAKPRAASTGSANPTALKTDPTLTMSQAESSAMRMSYKQRFQDGIDRPTTAEVLGISIRTLDRWHIAGCGPKRWKKYDKPMYYYCRTEVEAWVAEHGRGACRPRSAKNLNRSVPLGTEALQILEQNGHESSLSSGGRAA